ncbi:MAG: hypothetical protein KH020_02220 [Clostridiales bacterium]|nr:hypothetical protein [Clostridiales bacterium]
MKHVVKNVLKEKRDRLYHTQNIQNINILPGHKKYTIFHPDISKKQMFHVPSECIYNMDRRWSTEEIVLNEAGFSRIKRTYLRLPARINPNNYDRIIRLSKEEDKRYYFQIETFGSIFELEVNGQLIAVGDGKQRFYEIDVSEHLCSGKNIFSIQFYGEKKFIWESAKLLVRPINHIVDYSIGFQYFEQEKKIRIDIETSYKNELIPTFCSIVSPIGKTLAKIKLRLGKGTMDLQDVELWNHETKKQYILVFATKEEVIAEKVGFLDMSFENQRCRISGKKVELQVINLNRQIGCLPDELLQRELVKKLRSWKKRNFNAIYVEEKMCSEFLEEVCCEQGFYYIISHKEFQMVKKESILSEEGIFHPMPDVYFPIEIQILEPKKGLLGIKSKWNFGNIKEDYYIRICVCQGGQRIGHNIKYILDFEPETMETIDVSWISELDGKIEIHVELYQSIGNELIPKDYLYGKKVLTIEK